jgi:hypothetical protein
MIKWFGFAKRMVKRRLRRAFTSEMYREETYKMIQKKRV